MTPGVAWIRAISVVDPRNGRDARSESQTKAQASVCFNFEFPSACAKVARCAPSPFSDLSPTSATSGDSSCRA